MCDGRKLLPVHIILIVLGVIVYISGMCVAVYLGVVLFKRASKYIHVGRWIMFSTTHELYNYITVHKEKHSPMYVLHWYNPWIPEVYGVVCEQFTV